MSENFWEQRKLETEQTRQAELEKKAAEQKEKKKSQQQQQVGEKTEKKKEKQPKKVVEQKEQTQQQQPNGSAAAVEQKEKKKKNFKKNKEASQPTTSQPAEVTQDDFQTVERKTGGRRQFRGANKRNNNKKKENGEKTEKKKENKENKEQQPKKEEKTTTEGQQVVVQPVQIKVFSTTESAPVQGSDSWVSLLRGNQPESTSTTQQATTTTNGTAAASTKKSKPKSEKKTVVVKPATAEKTTTEAKSKPQKNYESGKNLLRSTEVEVDQALLDEVGVFIQPRGMTNINNSCYMNAVLQTLVSLPQFYHVMKRLGKISLDNEEYPLTNKFVRLVNEYQTMKTHRPQSGKEGEKKDRKYFINASTEHLVPSYIVDYIQQSSTNLEDAFLLGTQHDAHEFLNHILQRLHEELKKTETTLGRKSPSASKKKSKKQEATTSEQQEQTEAPSATSEEWKEVGKKNKANPMREHEMGDSSVVARTFAGKMKSFVQKQGETKGSSVVEPFFSLHLPIKDDNIKGVKFALREMTKEENVSDKSAKSSIYQLPKVLLLHLRRFDFSSTEGVQKISKRIRFDYELNIDEKVVPNVKAISGRTNLKYRLASVICHHGKDASSGHYSTYIQHGCGKWIHIDDTKVTVVSLQHVLDQQAYILTYVQDDNQEHYKLYSEGSSSSPLFSESSEQNGEKKKDHKKKEKKDKKEKKEKKSNTATTTTTTATTTTTETKTEAKTDV